MPSAGELGIFEALADSPASIDALAARTGLTQRDGTHQRRRHGCSGSAHSATPAPAAAHLRHCCLTPPSTGGIAANVTAAGSVLAAPRQDTVAVIRYEHRTPLQMDAEQTIGCARP